MCTRGPVGPGSVGGMHTTGMAMRYRDINGALEMQMHRAEVRGCRLVWAKQRWMVERARAHTMGRSHTRRDPGGKEARDKGHRGTRETRSRQKLDERRRRRGKRWRNERTCTSFSKQEG